MYFPPSNTLPSLDIIHGIGQAHTITMTKLETFALDSKPVETTNIPERDGQSISKLL